VADVVSDPLQVPTLLKRERPAVDQEHGPIAILQRQHGLPQSLREFPRVTSFA
jgi:hypothetical protein